MKNYDKWEGCFIYKNSFWKIFLILIFTLLISGCASATDSQSTTNSDSNKQITNVVDDIDSSTIILPDPINTRTGEHFTTIQGAIDSDNTIDGDTIIVEAGTYYENVMVNKKLNLIAQGTVIVLPADPEEPVFTIIKSGSGSSIEGFIIQGVGKTGIMLNGTDNCIIKGNTVSNFDCGIAAMTAGTILIENQIIGNDNGIHIIASQDNTVSGNIISNNTNGIIIEKSLDNKFSGNSLINNTTPLMITSMTEFTLIDFNQDIDSSNTINGKPVYYLVGKNGLLIDGNSPEYSSIGYLALVFCENIKVENVSISNNYEGMLLVGSHDISIKNSQFSNNNMGITLLNSSHNYIEKNQLDNNDFGLYLVDSDSNRIFDNIINHNLTWGISITQSSSYNKVFSNQINNNGNGLVLNGSIENALAGNTISNNNGYGVRVYNSPTNQFQENNFSDNKFNIDLTGNFSSYIQEQFDSSNTVNGKPVYYFMGKNGLLIDGNSPEYSNGIGYLALVLCNDTTVKNININNNGQGLLLAGTNNTVIENCNFKSNDEGISSQYSNNIIIKNNTITYNNDGISLNVSTGNIQFNRITDNTRALVNIGSSSLNATLNWWGTNNPDFSKIIVGVVNTTPWMVLSIHSNPSTVNIGGTSTITADLLHDNNGVYHNPADGMVPYTGTANFLTNKGTIINAVNFSNAKATATLTSLNTTGTATVSSTVDDQQIITDVLVVDPGATINQIITAAGIVKTYYETHGILPTTVLVGAQVVTMPQFLYLLATATRNISSGNLNPINIMAVNPASNPGGSYNHGNLQKASYLTVAFNIRNFIITNGRAPNYAQTSFGKIPFSKLLYMFSKVLNFYGNNIPNRLPNYINI